MRSLVNLLNEVGMLALIPRSGFAFLGAGRQSVAEHSYRTALIAYVLAKLSKEEVNLEKLLMICLTHDLPESRIGDLNYVQKRYVKADLAKVLKEIQKGSELGPELVNWIEEYEKNETIEAHLAHDADQLELLLVLKYEQDKGCPNIQSWHQNVYQRLKTQTAKQLADEIFRTPSDEWWV
jgi:putative hydrolase of HD superfamily